MIETIDRWPQIISSYSQLALTFDTDRLPALSGLASRLAPAMGSDYLAGLWKSDLELSLGWARVIPKKESTIGRSVRCSVPTPPSWSWASTTSAVEGKPEPVYFPTTQGFMKIKRESRVIESSCRLAGSDQFEAVSGGRIRNEAGIIPAALRHDHDRGDIHIVSFDDVHSTLFLTDISCHDLFPQKPEPVQALLLVSASLPADFRKLHSPGDLFGSTRTNRRAEFVLIVREIEGGNYERVGLALIHREWGSFKEVPVSEITLV